MAELIPHRLDAGSADLHGVLKLLHDSFAYMDPRIDPPSSLGRLTLENLTTFAADHEVWAISSPPQACMFLTTCDDHMYLGKLAVSKACRGTGLARTLVETAQERTRILGHTRLLLEVRIELTENHRFFQNLGFLEFTRKSHSGYDRPTSITFAKTIQ